MEYLAATIAVLATCVGVMGETRNKDGRGLRRLTPLGYAALGLALAAFVVSVAQTSATKADLATRRADADLALLDAADEVVGAIGTGLLTKAVGGLDEAISDTEKRLQVIGARFSRVIESSGDSLSEDVRKVALKIAFALTDNFAQIGNKSFAADYLKALDADIRELDKAVLETTSHSSIFRMHGAFLILDLTSNIRASYPGLK